MTLVTVNHLSPPTGIKKPCSIFLNCSCGDPPYIHNTFRDHSNSNLFPAGIVVKYNCVGGYELIPGISSASVTCQKDFTWSEHEEFCQKIRCPSPDITNGRVRPRKETYVYEDEIRIECDPSYALKDNYVSIKCERNGAWHPPLPICEPACEPPARISNGRDDRGWENVFLVGSSVSYSCNRGWSLVGVSSIRCTAGDGGTPRWDAPVPECKEIPHCPNPVTEHGKQISIHQTEYTIGNRVEFQCESGYILEGSKSIECQANKTWNPRVPSCVKACEPPARISNGWDDRGWRNVFLVGSCVTYDCDRGW
ncbi:C4b-binding protein alpha chain-like [Mauremys reevesii]|uniref:C4b-binding protein alpha chain-like n=1 Tax=Mauremys reevesii TaxID=260615 RepID=UPI00193F5AF2|nr:C4b-binding protein alpha chain-like [Mauremys reevesii]